MMELTNDLSNVNATSAPASIDALSSYRCFHMGPEFVQIYGGSTAPYILNCALNAVFSIVAFLGNSLALRGIWRIPNSMSTPATILLFNLAITDFVAGLIVQPMFVAALVLKIQGQHYTAMCLCSITFIVFTSCATVVSLMTATAISLDKYMALYLHLRYKELVTVRRVLLVLCVIWFSSIFAGTVWLWDYKLFDPYLVFAAFVMITLVTSTAYFKVYRILRRHQAQIQAQLQLQARIQAQGEIPSQPANKGNGPSVDRKSATTSLLVYCLLLVCYVPYISFEVAVRSIGISPGMELIREFIFTLYLVNSSLNPIVYCWRVKEVRATVYDTVRRIRQIFSKN